MSPGGVRYRQTLRSPRSVNPNLPFIDHDAVFLTDQAQLVLEREALVMVFLVADVALEVRNLGCAHGKGGIPLLPVEPSVCGSLALEPLGGLRLDLLGRSC